MKKYLPLIVFILCLSDSISQTIGQFRIVDEFKKSSNDSLFVLQRSEKKEFSFVINTWLTDSLSEVELIIFNTQLNSVVGPFETDSFFVWFKMQKADSLFKMRACNIWINREDFNMDSSYAQAKQILSRAQQGESFDLLCKKFSGDNNTNYECDLGWFWETRMVTEFSDEIKLHKKGDIFIVKTRFGWHVVKMLTNPYLDRIKIKAIPLYLRKN